MYIFANYFRCRTKTNSVLRVILFFRVNTFRYSHDMALICTARLGRDTIIFVLSCLLTVAPQNSSSCSLVTALPNTNLESSKTCGMSFVPCSSQPLFSEVFLHLFFGNKKVRKEDKIESDRTRLKVFERNNS